MTLPVNQVCTRWPIVSSMSNIAILLKHFIQGVRWMHCEVQVTFACFAVVRKRAQRIHLRNDSKMFVKCLFLNF